LEVVGQIRASTNGSVSAPALLINDSNSGIFRESTNGVLGISCNGTEVIRFEDTGNVGIGTTAPSGNLSIKSGTNTDMELYSETSGVSIVSYNRTDDSDGYIRFNTSSEAMRILPNGNVGIGTASPGTLLELAGGGSDLLTVNSTSSYAGILFEESGTSRFALRTNDGTSGLKFYDTGASAERMRIDASGNVGIGTAAPGAMLHVHGTEFRHQTNSAYNSFFNEAGTRRGYIQFNEEAGFLLESEFSPAKTMTFQNYAGDIVLGCGACGIGTAAPTNASLVVNNSSTSSPVTSLELMGGSIVDGGGTGIFLKASSNTTADRYGAKIHTIREAGGSGATSLVFSTDTNSALAEAVRIDSSGNVGIGVTDPDEQLELTGRLHLGQTTAPGTTTDKLYNVSGSLYWNGTDISAGGGDTLHVETISSGTTGSVSENGMDQLIKVTHSMDLPSSFALTLPRPADCPAGRRMQIWFMDGDAYYYHLKTSSTSDKFGLNYDITNNNDLYAYCEGYGNAPILELISDGGEIWYQTADHSGYGWWYGTGSPS
jgi:hypothetical protein